MKISLTIDKDKPEAPETPDAERQARIDLTAALRWAERLGLNEGVCNHFSMVLPGRGDCFLLNPQGLHWSELKTSDLIVVDADGRLVEGKHSAEPTAFFIHSRIHCRQARARCVLHTHMPYATALTCLENGRLEFCHQNALRFFGRVGYDDGFAGLALDAAEGDRLADKLADASVLFLAHHGVIVTGQDIARAFDDLYYLERACQVQVLAMSTGRPLKLIPPAIAEATREQIEQEQQQSVLHLAAIRRVLEREAPDFLD